MSVTQVSPVPLDVCFIIIDLIANDDGDPIIGTRYATIRVCALTCQDWLEKFRVQLYASVVLRRWVDFECFTENVASSSYLGSLVKSLRCELGHLMDTGDVDLAPLPMHIIPRLVSLKSLTVVSNVIPFSTSFVEFLKSFSMCATLDSLYIRGCHFVAFKDLAGAVLSFSHIQSLQIRQCGWYSRGSMNWSAYAPFNHLANGSRVLETVSFNYLSIDQRPETVKNQLTEQVIDGILRASPFASVRRVVVKLFANDPSNDGERRSKAPNP